uniref:Uncharacterized protein n=1 Tax=Rhizophora mucronata TaxID=61149 RepID=A0A2P2QWN8_RHIMU
MSVFLFIFTAIKFKSTLRVCPPSLDEVNLSLFMWIRNCSPSHLGH